MTMEHEVSSIREKINCLLGPGRAAKQAKIDEENRIEREKKKEENRMLREKLRQHKLHEKALNKIEKTREEAREIPFYKPIVRYKINRTLNQLERQARREYPLGYESYKANIEADRRYSSSESRLEINKRKEEAKAIKAEHKRKGRLVLLKTPFGEDRYVEKRGSCFVATAVYGDENAPEVCALRDFRDKTLRSYTLGRAFIRAYYSGAGEYTAAIISRCVPSTIPLLRTGLNYIIECHARKTKEDLPRREHD